MSAHLSTLVTQYGDLAIFVLMILESACIPIPSEAVMTFGGYQASMHHLNLWSVIVVGTIANLVGGLITYYIGLRGGRAFILKYGKYILLSERHLTHAERWFARRGEATVFLGRMLPGVRTFISLPAGIAKMPLGKFMVFSALGSLPWNFALTYAGYQFGAHWETFSKYMKPFTYVGAIMLVAGVIWFWSVRRKSDYDVTSR